MVALYPGKTSECNRTNAGTSYFAILLMTIAEFLPTLKATLLVLLVAQMAWLYARFMASPPRFLRNRLGRAQ
ncbi:MAG: hypothetical protein BA861_06960 [Desulfobacterales bacterium S3730MH5]|nr:MAG: hypothetical protein BA861_06960 [Desulfobacterales bacterium S3730MH5]